MTQKELGDRVESITKELSDLDKLVAVIVEQLKAVNRSLDALNAGQKEAAERHAELQRDHEREVAVLKQLLDELRRWTEKNGVSDLKVEIGLLKEKVSKLEAAQERSGTRAWSVVPNVLGAIVSSTLAGVIAYFVARKP